MARLHLAILIGLLVLVPLVLLADSAGVGSWGLTGIGVAVMFLISLIDREGFYGPRDSRRR